MSVIVKGMDLPLGCCYEEYEKWYGHTEYCPFCNHDDVPYCILEPNNMVDEELLFIGIDSRPDWCPLIKIPSGLKLVDANELIDKSEWYGERATYNNPMPDGVEAVSVEDIENATVIYEEESCQ